MRAEDQETLRGFEAAVAAIPNVVQAQRLFGDPELSALPGVQRMNSTLVMKQIVDHRPLPA